MANGTNGKRPGAWYVTQLWWRTLKISYLRHFTSGGHFMGAAIAFYALVGLAPLGLLLATLMQHVLQTTLDSDLAYQRLAGFIHEVAGGATDEIMQLVRTQAERMGHMTATGNLYAQLVSAATLIWAGLRLFDIIQLCLGTIWPGHRVRVFIFRKLVSLAMMAVSGLLFAALVALLSTRGAINEWLSSLPEVDLPLVLPHSIVTFFLGAMISTLAYLLLYKFMPVQRVSLRAALAGAVLAAIIWQSISPIFTRFIALSQYLDTVFGTLTWMIIFGVWAFWGAQIMLYGAQFAAAYEHVFIRRRPRSEDDSLIDLSRRRTQVYYGDRDAEAEQIIEDLGLGREAAACAGDAAGNQLVNGIILDGGRVSPLFAQEVGTDIKGLIPIDGRASIEYVVDAMRGVPGMRKIVLVGDKAAYLHHPVAANLDGIIDEGSDLWHNLLRAIRFLNEDRRVLLATSDTPLLTAEALCSFLGKCDPGADLCYPVTRRTATASLFHRRLWVFLPLRDGWLTHTCTVLFDPRLMLKNQDFAERFISRRKDLWGAASAVGLRFMVRFLLGWYLPFLRYDPPGIAHQIELMTGARKAQGVVLEYPEIALDLDKPSDVEEAEAFLAHAKAESEAAKRQSGRLPE